MKESWQSISLESARVCSVSDFIFSASESVQSCPSWCLFSIVSIRSVCPSSWVEVDRESTCRLGQGTRFLRWRGYNVSHVSEAISPRFTNRIRYPACAIVHLYSITKVHARIVISIAVPWRSLLLHWAPQLQATSVHHSRYWPSMDAVNATVWLTSVYMWQASYEQHLSYRLRRLCDYSAVWWLLFVVVI